MAGTYCQCCIIRFCDASSINGKFNVMNKYFYDILSVKGDLIQGNLFASVI